MKTILNAKKRGCGLPESMETRQTGAEDKAFSRMCAKSRSGETAEHGETARTDGKTGKNLSRFSGSNIGAQEVTERDEAEKTGGTGEHFSRPVPGLSVRAAAESLPRPADRGNDLQDAAEHGEAEKTGGTGERFSHPVPGLSARAAAESLPRPADRGNDLQDAAEHGEAEKTGGVGERFSHPVPGLSARAAAGFSCPDIKTISTPALAYLGDAVIELFVRKWLVAEGLSSSKALNRRALDFVRASAQAAAMERLLPHLTDEETAIFRRGRNIGHTNTPKSATVAEYRNATGMEVLFGYLHMTGKTDRAAALFLLAYEEEKSI